MTDAVAGVQIPVLMDDAQIVSKALGLTHMDQAVIYDPSSFEVVYRGPVQSELEQTLRRLIADESRCITPQPAGR